MIRSVWTTPLTLALVLLLGACGSARFGGETGRGVRSAAVTRPAPISNAPEVIDPVEGAPAGAVTSEPLPPLGATEPLESTDPLVGPITAEPSPAPASPPPQQVAAVSAGRSSYVGGWNARDASGASCTRQLSSSPALDLYRASASGCANRDLARVTAWDYREGEVYLYQPGGGVAARLRPAGGAMDGVLAKSGAPLTLAR